MTSARVKVLKPAAPYFCSKPTSHFRSSGVKARLLLFASASSCSVTWPILKSDSKFSAICWSVMVLRGRSSSRFSSSCTELIASSTAMAFSRGVPVNMVLRSSS